ncbi:MAG: hypothetical protein K2Q21_07870 [Chitinophagaceae bacterium]|nr:hypothetical protein [Chitinophagaceae bacterium]
MKNLLLFFLCILVLNTVNAQFTKGQRTIDGQFSFFNQHYSGSTNTYSAPTNNSSLGLALSLSRFSNPNTIKGFGLRYFYSDNGSFQIRNGAAAFYSYTKLETLAKQFYLSFSGVGNVYYNEDKWVVINTPYKETGLGVGINLEMGLLYQLNQRFLITARLVNLANLNYTNYRTQQYPTSGSLPEPAKSSSVNFYTGLNGFSLNNISIGFRYLLK